MAQPNGKGWRNIFVDIDIGINKSISETNQNSCLFIVIPFLKQTGLPITHFFSSFDSWRENILCLRCYGRFEGWVLSNKLCFLG